MFRRTMFVFFGFILPFFSIAQMVNVKDADLKRFMSSKLYVVMDEDPFSDFNASISECMQLHWKLIPYEIIDAKKFASLRTNPEFSFMFVSMAEVTQTKTSLFPSNTLLFKNKMSSRFVVLNISMGDKSGNIQRMPEIISVPLSYYFEVDEDDDDTEDPEYGYKLGAIIKSMAYVIEKKASQPSLNIEREIKSYMSEVKNYELWLLTSDLPENLQNVQNISKIYPHIVKIVTQEEIEQAIKTSMKNVAILHKIGPEDYPLKDVYCFKTLISVEDGKPLYFDYHTITNQKSDAFLKEDFEKLLK
jgi:hypothetical protein